MWLAPDFFAIPGIIDMTNHTNVLRGDALWVCFVAPFGMYDIDILDYDITDCLRKPTRLKDNAIVLLPYHSVRDTGLRLI